MFDKNTPKHLYFSRMPSKRKRQRQGKERKIEVGEIVESMERVKKCWINGFPHAKKENAYQLHLTST
jgi:hypothetical protein